MIDLARCAADLETVWTQFSLSAGVPNPQMLGANPLRYSLSFVGGVNFGYFSPDFDRGLSTGLYIGNQNGSTSWLQLDYRRFGSAIQAPWYGRTFSGTATFWTMETLYKGTAVDLAADARNFPYKFSTPLISTAGGSQIVGADPTRWCLYIACASNGAYVEPDSDRGAATGFLLGTAGGSASTLILDFPTFGSVVQSAWYGRPVSVNNNLMVLEVFYRPVAA